MKKVLYVLIVLDVMFMLFLSYNYFFIVHYTVIDGEDITTSLYSKYKDPGLNASYRGKKVKKIEVNNKVDTEELGTYDVTYKLNYGSKTKKVKRHVRVIDDEGPVITLKGKNEIDVDYGTIYVEEGYEVIDKHDGNVAETLKITGNIDTKKIGAQVISYKANDKSNNYTEVKRTINVKDMSGPKIDIGRSTNSYLIRGTSFDVNSFSAIDNYDGDVKDKVVVEGNADTSKNGVYSIKYTVKDSNGNETVLDTTINVQEKNTSGVPVLMYHWFYDDVNGEKAKEGSNPNYLAASTLEEQFKYLNDNGFYYPTWQELEDYIDGKIELPKKSIILTDDDGNESFFRIALKLSEKYKIPFTSFVVTDRGGWEGYIDSKYLILESHSHSLHQRSCNKKWDGKAMCMSYDELKTDTTDSLNIIKGATVLAYPFGHYSDDYIKALKDSGIKMAFTINNGKTKKGANKYKLPRVRISKGISISEFAKKVN